MNRLFIALLISSLGTLLLLAAGTMPAAAQETYTATPAADARVNAAAPDTNYGLLSRLDVRGAGSGSGEIRSFIRFDSIAAMSPVSAVVHIEAEQAAIAPTIFVHSVDSGWLENTLTWNNAPPLESLIFEYDGTANGDIQEIDVTHLAKNGPVSIALSTDSTATNGYYWSGESASAPEMVYLLPSPTPTAVPPPAEPQLIHCYDFDNSANDLIGGVNWTLPINWSFNGTELTGNSGVASASYGDLDQFSFSFWFHGDLANVYQATGLWGMAIGTNSENLDSVESGFVPITGGTTPITSDEYHHYVLTADGSEFVLYRDGVEVNTATQYPTNKLDDLRISTAGKIDAMSIYSGVTDPAALYAAGVTACVDQLDPTAVVISQQLISLPSGGLARVDMTATAGELFVTGVLLMLIFISIWQAVERLANFNSKR